MSYPQSCLFISCVALSLLALAGGCGGSGGFNTQQQGVYSAMQEWTGACEARDTEAMWSLLSPDAKEFYRRELQAVRHVHSLHTEALLPESMISDAKRKQEEEALRRLPEDPEAMSAADYYGWRIADELTPAEIINQGKLFARNNILDIEIDGERATVILKNGRPSRYSWRIFEGDWKFDLSPASLRALEAGQQSEPSRSR